MFEGVLTALVTPLRDGGLDEPALRDLVERQIEAGIDGLVPCGSTGESATLSYAEHHRVVELVIETARGRVPVVAGTGSNNTAEAIALTRHAVEAGADGALLISPYYNKPTQQGIVAHYSAVARAAALPLLVYNIPGRTGSNILPATMARLADIEHVVGVKEACGDLGQIGEVIARCGSDFCVLSGDDALTLPMLALGAKGVVSTTSNVAPAE
ncbi:MAG: 4-hydroxy-tetrahydrodipicolinate synthase, partial [Myxococcales bacterium]|nr:4-hydroxy-tetrahydrodipicolinate synthase [Myxococcales bacterium]